MDLITDYTQNNKYNETEAWLQKVSRLKPKKKKRMEKYRNDH